MVETPKLVFIQPPKPAPQGGGGGGMTYIPPPEAPPPPPEAVAPPPPPTETPKEIPPAESAAPIAANADASGGSGGPGTGGGSGGGDGKGQGTGTGDGAAPAPDGPIAPPVWIAGALPLEKPPEDLRGKTLNVTFFVNPQGRVDRAETDPPIADGGYAAKFRDVWRTFRFKPARKPDGSAVAASIVIAFQLGNR
ncbi:MAG: hypothetical protein NW201_03150 [Gemmatimonadales bacterium]|nr:hypothetical protein [Gemmatimonadales bacterium]